MWASACLKDASSPAGSIPSLEVQTCCKSSSLLPGTGPGWVQGLTVAAVPAELGCRVPCRHRHILLLLDTGPRALVGARDLYYAWAGQLVLMPV